MIKIGIVGAGGMATERVRAFASTGQATVAGIYSQNPEKAQRVADMANAVVFADYGQLLENVDAIIVCVPNNIHLQIAITALQAKKHVLVEYPIATKWEDAMQLKAASLTHNSVLMVGNTIIHESGFKYICTNKHRLGDIISAASRVAFYNAANSGMWFMDCLQLGPVFSSLHYHHIEFYKHFLGQAEWVLGCDASKIDAASNQYKSMVGGTLLLGYDAGKNSCIQWYLGSTGSGLSRGMWINGTHGTLSLVSIQSGKTHVVWEQGGDSEIIAEDWGVDGSCRDFLMAIQGELDHRARLQSDFHTFQVGLAGRDSVRTGGIVHLN